MNNIIDKIIRDVTNKKYRKVDINPKNIHWDTTYDIDFESEDRIVDESMNTFLYLWGKAHDDSRVDVFEYILIPESVNEDDFKNTSFEELLHFISPQTKITQT